MKKEKSTLQILAFASGIGFNFAAIVCTCAYIGYQADRHFDTAPDFLVVGLIIGFIMAFISIYKTLKRGSLW